MSGVCAVVVNSVSDSSSAMESSSSSTTATNDSSTGLEGDNGTSWFSNTPNSSGSTPRFLRSGSDNDQGMTDDSGGSWFSGDGGGDWDF